MRRDRLPLLLIPVAAFIAILPLALHGASCGHDFDFHILNWFEAADQFRHGNLHPQWAVSPAFNAGEPRFLFYPPLSWTLGALLGLVLPWIATPALYTWLALTASGLSLYRLARAFTTPGASVIAATLYLANPYMLFTAYERTAYAELLAATWLPLLFLAILKPRPTVPAIALPVALLWLTNAPAAVMGTYTLALLALCRLLQAARRDRQATPRPAANSFREAPPAALALTTLGGTLLGLALAAFYIIPAATGRRFVQIALAVVPGLRVDDNTLFHHTGLTPDELFHDSVLHTASLLAILLLAASTIALACITLRARSKLSKPVVPLAVLTLLIAVLLTPASLPLWHHAPELAFLQFPWRLLAILATVLALATALALHRLPWKPLPITAAVLALASVLTFLSAPRFRQACDEEDALPARLALFQSGQGTEPTDEYTPQTADNEVLGHRNPPFWLAPAGEAPPPYSAQPAPLPSDLSVTSPIAQYLILNHRLYPDWHILLNGREVTPAPLRSDGLIAIPITPGKTRVHLSFQPSPLARRATLLSLFAFAILCLLALRPHLSSSADDRRQQEHQ